MLKYITNNEINKQKWDECISQSFNGIIYAYSWYLDIVCKDWDALVEDDYKAVMPLTGSKKYGFNYLFPPPFTQQLGVFSVNKLDEEIVQKFIDAVPEKFKYFEINLNTFNNFTSTKYNTKRNITCELDLIDTYENAFKKYAENTKRNIKKAITNNLVIEVDADANSLIQIFLDTRGKTLKNIDYQVLKQLVKICSDRNKAKVIGVKNKENKLCAGAIFVADLGKIMFVASDLIIFIASEWPSEIHIRICLSD